MHVGATHVSANFSRGLVHNFYEGVVVHLMEGLVVPDLNDTKCDLAHRNTTWNKRVAISKNNQQLKKPRPGMQQYTILNDCFDGVKKENYPTTYIQAGASALACQGCSIHTLSSSPDLNKIGVVILSFSLQKTLAFYPHRWLQIRTYPPPPVKGRRGSVQAVVDSEGGDPLSAAPLSLAERWRGRSSDPFVAALVWADPASRRPPIHIPTTFRYIFIRNRLSSTSPARYVAACASFSTSQPVSIGWSNVTYFFLLLLEVKLLHGVESCTT